MSKKRDLEMSIPEQEKMLADRRSLDALGWKFDQGTVGPAGQFGEFAEHPDYGSIIKMFEGSCVGRDMNILICQVNKACNHMMRTRIVK